MGTDFIQVPDFPGYYATKDGRVWSTWKAGCKPLPDAAEPRVVKHAIHKGGYHQICLRKDGVRFKVYIHEVILRTFVGPRPDGKTHARHLNGNPSDNRIKNLVWGTASENSRDRFRHGTCAQAKLTEEQVVAIREAEGTNTQLAERFGISRYQVGRIRARFSWRHVQ